jgi:hypothetical protein
MEIKDVLSLKMKPKEKVDKITNIVIDNPGKISELINNFKQGTDVEKGTYANVLKQVSERNPDIVEPFLEELFEDINHKCARASICACLTIDIVFTSIYCVKLMD